MESTRSVYRRLSPNPRPSRLQTQAIRQLQAYGWGGRILISQRMVRYTFGYSSTFTTCVLFCALIERTSIVPKRRPASSPAVVVKLRYVATSPLLPRSRTQHQPALRPSLVNIQKALHSVERLAGGRVRGRGKGRPGWQPTPSSVTGHTCGPKRGRHQASEGSKIPMCPQNGVTLLKDYAPGWPPWL
ncbi:hypothetical protein BKA93DRAFT_42702 [Sparassis latifolia]